MRKLKPVFTAALLFVILSFSILNLYAQSGKELQITDQKSTLKNSSFSYFLAYFKRNLETENLEKIESVYYNKTIHTPLLKIEKERVWELWKEANNERLATLPSASKDGSEFIWDIPQGQRMKIQTFTKGEKPASGYPFFINLHGGGDMEICQALGILKQTLMNGLQPKCWVKPIRIVQAIILYPEWLMTGSEDGIIALNKFPG